MTTNQSNQHQGESAIPAPQGWRALKLGEQLADGDRCYFQGTVLDFSDWDRVSVENSSHSLVERDDVGWYYRPIEPKAPQQVEANGADLLPCPFCGVNPVSRRIISDDGWQITCEESECGWAAVYADNEAEAVAQWQSRRYLGTPDQSSIETTILPRGVAPMTFDQWWVTRPESDGLAFVEDIAKAAWDAAKGSGV